MRDLILEVNFKKLSIENIDSIWKFRKVISFERNFLTAVRKRQNVDCEISKRYRF